MEAELSEGSGQYHTEPLSRGALSLRKSIGRSLKLQPQRVPVSSIQDHISDDSDELDEASLSNGSAAASTVATILAAGRRVGRYPSGSDLSGSSVTDKENVSGVRASHPFDLLTPMARCGATPLPARSTPRQPLGLLAESPFEPAPTSQPSATSAVKRPFLFGDGGGEKRVPLAHASSHSTLPGERTPAGLSRGLSEGWLPGRGVRVPLLSAGRRRGDAPADGTPPDGAASGLQQTPPEQMLARGLTSSAPASGPSARTTPTVAAQVGSASRRGYAEVNADSRPPCPLSPRRQAAHPARAPTPTVTGLARGRDTVQTSAGRDVLDGCASQPGDAQDSRVGHMSQPSAARYSSAGHMSQPSAAQDSRIGRMSQPSVAQDSRAGHMSQPSVAQDSRIGRMSQPSVAQDSRIGRMSQPSVAQDSRAGHVSQPSAFHDSRAGYVAQYSAAQDHRASSMPRQNGRIFTPQPPLTSQGSDARDASHRLTPSVADGRAYCSSQQRLLFAGHEPASHVNQRLASAPPQQGSYLTPSTSQHRGSVSSVVYASRGSVSTPRPCVVQSEPATPPVGVLTGTPSATVTCAVAGPRVSPGTESRATADSCTQTETDSIAMPPPRTEFVFGKRVLRPITVNGHDYIVVKPIGRGGSSKVYHVFDSDMRSLAVKQVFLENADEAAASGYMNEIALLRRLQHSNRVVRLVDSEHDEHRQMLYIVMEKGDTDLTALLRTYSKLNEVDANMCKFFWGEMLRCVDVIHKEGIVHSDLKPSNFLMVSGRLKLIDFGIASQIQSECTSILKDTQVGTFNYMSPEAMGTQTDTRSDSTQPAIKISRRSDVWSLGCILYNFTYGTTPFGSIKEVLKKMMAILNPRHEIHFADVPDCHLMSVLRACLQRDPYRRPSIEELLSHPYLVGGACQCRQ